MNSGLRKSHIQVRGATHLNGSATFAKPWMDLGVLAFGVEQVFNGIPPDLISHSHSIAHGVRNSFSKPHGSEQDFLNFSQKVRQLKAVLPVPCAPPHFNPYSEI